MKFLRNISSYSGDDLELVSAYQETGNTRIVAELYMRYTELAYAVCYKYLKDAEVAKDAVMDIYEVLTQKLLNHQVTNFRSWLYTLIKNHCLMQLRTGSRMQVVGMDESRMQTGEELHHDGIQEKEWQFEQLTRCIGTLGEEQKGAIELFYLKGKCYKEISVATGIGWDRVRSLIQNGRRNLKLCMDQAEKGRGINIHQENK